FEALGGSNLMMVFSARSAASDLAARAARACLSISKIAPTLRLALATGTAVVTDKIPLGDVVDRAAALLESASDATISLDSASAGLLPSRFQLVSGSGRFLLVGERE